MNDEKNNLVEPKESLTIVEDINKEEKPSIFILSSPYGFMERLPEISDGLPIRFYNGSEYFDGCFFC